VSVESDEEFRDFMQGRWSAMVRLAYTLTGDQGHAEDIAQAAFAKVYASWGRVRQAGDPDAYTRAIVIHENSNRFRRQRVREDLRADVPERGSAGKFTIQGPQPTGFSEEQAKALAARL
jgi:DNA-directed RNA polymerase specialized sigma24 family protein